jgi:hypothetical protein
MNNFEENVSLSINEKLDRCAIELIECYEDILKQHDLLNKCLDMGYLNLSKARSIVGCTNLSTMQIPAEIEASVTVDIIEEKLFFQNCIEYKNLEFNLKINDNKKDKNTESNLKNEIIALPNWFGVLTPLSLKSSQKSFCNSYAIIKSLCESQIKLKNLQIVYKRLLAEI